MLVVLAAAGATTLAFKTIKPEVPQQRAPSAEPNDPAILITHLRNLGAEMALHQLANHPALRHMQMREVSM